MTIKVHVLTPGSIDPQAVEIAEEILIADLLQQLLDGRHEQFDLFPEGRSEPHHRHRSAKDVGIKNGDVVHCLPKVREIRVHIDQTPFQSPSSTTGIALYQLGNVAAGHQLYREVRGNEEDEPIFRDEELFHLEEDAHFHSSDKPFKGFEIFVNTRPKVVHKRLLTLDEIVNLAFNPRPTGPNIEFTVNFHNAAGRHSEGEMVSTAHSGKYGRHFVKIKNGTVFDVGYTDRS